MTHINNNASNRKRLEESNRTIGQYQYELRVSDRVGLLINTSSFSKELEVKCVGSRVMMATGVRMQEVLEDLQAYNTEIPFCRGYLFLMKKDHLFFLRAYHLADVILPWPILRLVPDQPRLAKRSESDLPQRYIGVKTRTSHSNFKFQFLAIFSNFSQKKYDGE